MCAGKAVHPWSAKLVTSPKTNSPRIWMADAEEAPAGAPAADDAAGSNGKVPQSLRPGGKKRKVALYIAFVGAGYSVSDPPFWPGTYSLLPVHSASRAAHVCHNQGHMPCSTCMHSIVLTDPAHSHPSSMCSLLPEQC